MVSLKLCFLMLVPHDFGWENFPPLYQVMVTTCWISWCHFMYSALSLWFLLIMYHRLLSTSSFKLFEETGKLCTSTFDFSCKWRMWKEGDRMGIIKKKTWGNTVSSLELQQGLRDMCDSSFLQPYGSFEQRLIHFLIWVQKIITQLFLLG